MGVNGWDGKNPVWYQVTGIRTERTSGDLFAEDQLRTQVVATCISNKDTKAKFNKIFRGGPYHIDHLRWYKQQERNGDEEADEGE